MEKIDALLGAKFWQILAWSGALMAVAGVADLPWLPIHPGYRIAAIVIGLLLLAVAGRLAWIRARRMGGE